MKYSAIATAIPIQTRSYYLSVVAFNDGLLQLPVMLLKLRWGSVETYSMWATAAAYTYLLLVTSTSLYFSSHILYFSTSIIVRLFCFIFFGVRFVTIGLELLIKSDMLGRSTSVISLGLHNAIHTHPCTLFTFFLASSFFIAIVFRTSAILVARSSANWCRVLATTSVCRSTHVQAFDVELQFKARKLKYVPPHNSHCLRSTNLDLSVQSHSSSVRVDWAVTGLATTFCLFALYFRHNPSNFCAYSLSNCTLSFAKLRNSSRNAIPSATWSAMVGTWSW
jgi:hypothetical protein